MADPRHTAEKFVVELVAKFGDRLTNAVIYGSVARGEAVAGVSDINVLLLFDEIDERLLQAASPAARRWVEAGNTAPLVMTATEWRRAADAFAIEVLDMKDAHIVLKGADPVDGMHVDLQHLRLQAEREVRGKQVQLREGLLLVADRPDEIGRLLMAALPSFTTYLRAVLRLAGREVPADSAEVIRSGCGLVGADTAPLLDVWEARQEKSTIPAEAADGLVTGYYNAVEQLANHIDALAEENA